MNNNTSHKSLMSLFKSLWVHISKRRKVQFSFLLILTLVASVAEVASLGAVLPFIGILTQPDQVFESPWLEGFITFFEISSGDELILPLTIAFGSAAIIAGLSSMIAFIGLTLGAGDSGELVNKVMLADVLGSLALLVVILLRWISSTSKQEKL